MNIVKNSITRLIFGAFLISFSAIFVKLSDLDPDVAAFYRMVFGLIPLTVFSLKNILEDNVRMSAKSLILPVAAGLMFSGDLFFWHKSINYIGPGMATLLGNFQVFYVSLIAFTFMKEKLSLNFAFSAPFAFLGVCMLTSGGRLESGEGFYIGVAFGLITSFFYAVYIITVRKCRIRYPGLNSYIIMFIVTLTSCVIFGVYLFITGKNFMIYERKPLILMMIYGFSSQFLGWITISNALPKVRVSLAGLLILIQPVLSYIWDVLIFHKTINIVEGAGIVIALISIYIGSVQKA